MADRGMAQQQYAPGANGVYGMAPPNPLNWVPPPGWVAPPGWAEYQQFLAAQHSGAYTNGGGANGGYPQQMMPQAGMSYPYPVNTQMPAAGYGHPISPSGRHTVATTPQQQQQFQAYPAGYPAGYAPPPTHQHQQQMYPQQGQYPVNYGYMYQTPPPEMVHANGRQSQYPQTAGGGGQYYPPQQQAYGVPPPQQPTTRPPPPPADPPARPPRVKVEFEDADSDEERLARHDTLGVFDVEDIHEIDETDFAELDTGKEQNVADAGIIQGGVAIQPAIELRDTASRQSTTVPVMSVSVNDGHGRLPANVVEYSDSSEDEDEAGDNKKSDEDKKKKTHEPHKSETITSTGSTLSRPPLPVSRQNSAMNNDQAPTAKRRSTFGALLGAAAAMFSGSNRKLGSISGPNSRNGSALFLSGSSKEMKEQGREIAEKEETATPVNDTQQNSATTTIPEPSASPETVDEPSGLIQPAEDEESKEQPSVPQPSPSPVESSPIVEETSKQEEEDSPAKDAAIAATATAAAMLSMAAAMVTSAATAVSDVSSTVAAAAAAVTTTATAPAAAEPVASASPPVAVPPSPAPAAEEDKVVHIKVRTLAGKAAIFEVDSDMTLFEFRELIHEHFQTIPLDEQRLLFKGKMIEMLSPQITLEELGFKDNDLIHLVRTVGAKKPEATEIVAPKTAIPSVADTSSSISLNSAAAGEERSAAAPPQTQAQPQQQAQQPLQMLTVLVPPGRGPGDRLRILPQGRGPMLVTVPAGVFAGDRFRVLLPPEDPAELQRAEQLMHIENMRHQELLRQQQETLARQQQQAKPQIMAVVVPKGFKAGQVMDVNVPGRGRVRVTIPNGVKAGQQFKFRLPN